MPIQAVPFSHTCFDFRVAAQETSIFCLDIKYFNYNKFPDINYFVIQIPLVPVV